MPRRAARPPRLLLTCEHGGNRIPREYAELFRGAARTLASHRGWDPGALLVARELAGRMHAPLLAVTWSRLLVESNRSPTNPRIWSPYTGGLPRPERERILQRYWWPHRRRVEESVRQAIASGSRVLHVAVHSFAPGLDGAVRRADVGLLYDSGRVWETGLCRRWQATLGRIDPELRVRRNYPYRGNADGLTTWLRGRFAGRRYAGVELEMNQALLRAQRHRALARTLAHGLESLLAPGAPAGSSLPSSGRRSRSGPSSRP